VLLASSEGAMLGTLRDLLVWARASQAAFHVTDNKTVAMVAGVRIDREGSLVLEDVTGREVRLKHKSQHKWLGAIWDQRLDFTADVMAKLAVASRTCDL